MIHDGTSPPSGGVQDWGRLPATRCVRLRRACDRLAVCRRPAAPGFAALAIAGVSCAERSPGAAMLARLAPPAGRRAWALVRRGVRPGLAAGRPVAPAAQQHQAAAPRTAAPRTA